MRHPIIAGQSLSCGAILAFALLAIAIPKGSTAIPIQKVDRTTVLRIGDVEVSQYAIDKNYQLWVAECQRAHRGGQSPYETQLWFKLFIAKKIITAEAMACHFASRKEVLGAVEGMEQYMLTNPDGPFYHHLYPQPAISRQTLMALYAETAKIFDIVAIQFPVSRTDELLGADWKAATTEERLKRMDHITSRPGLQASRGECRWPYDIFGNNDAGEALSKAKAGDWLYGASQNSHDEQEWLIYVRLAQCRSMPEFSSEETAFGEQVRIYNAKRCALWRRVELLERTRFTFNESMAKLLVERIDRLPYSTIDLPEQTIGSFGDQELFNYFSDGVVTRVSIACWLRYYNGLFLRRLPVTVSRLRESAADMTMMHLDCCEASKVGVDRTPQFLEDRRNFLYGTTLEMFERERLKTTGEIDEVMVSAYWKAHSSEFAAVPTASGLLFSFPSEQSAREWTPSKEEKRRMVHQSVGMEAMHPTAYEVSVLHPVPGLERYTDAILSASPSTTYGPTQIDGAWIVFLKTDATRVSAPTLALETRQIRGMIARTFRDRAELELASGVWRNFPIYDGIPYHNYGITANVAPWAQ